MSSALLRRFRHARRILGYGLLSVLILAALAVSVLSRMLPLVDQHPDKVTRWLAERIGQPVAFSHARGEWTRRGPRFTFDDLQIGAGDSRLDIGHAELLVAVYSGLLPGEPLTELKVRDLSLLLEQGADGRWGVVGLPFEVQPGVDPLDTLQALGELQIERARLTIRSPAISRALLLPRVDVRLRVSGNQLRAGARAWAQLGGEPMAAVADLARSDWSGRLWAGGRSLRLDDWSPLLAESGVAVSGSGDLDLWARIDAQRVTDVRTRAELAPLLLRPRRAWLADEAGELTSPRVAYERASMLARWQLDEKGWQLHAPELNFQQRGRRGPRSFDGLWLAGGQQYALQAPRMDLAAARALASLSPRVPPGLRRWLHEAAPEGVLREVRVQGREGRWSGSAELAQVGWRGHGKSPGLQGVSGNAAFDQDGGVLRLEGSSARLDWALLRQPLDLQLGGTLGWWRDGERWTLGASGLRVRGDEFGARVRAELQFQGDGSRPRLDLAAAVDPSTVRAAKFFWIVGKMPPATMQWLDTALEQGVVEDGRATLAGDLDDWPFRSGQGRFDARAHLRGGRVAFNPAWPAAEALELDVAFDGPGMSLQGEGMIQGNRVRQVAGAIADFKDPRLRLAVDTPANGESLQALMLASPLMDRFGEHLRSAKVRGPASVTLALDLPLAARLGGRRIEGTLDLQNARLSDPRWDLDFTEVTGRTRYSDQGFAAEQLAVNFEGQPATFSLQVGEVFTANPALAARATLEGRFPGQVLLDRHPPLAWLDSALAGSSTWTVVVDIPKAPADGPSPPARLSVDSDLVGTAITLPAPLAKPESEAIPLHLEAPLPVRGGDVNLRLGDVMRLRGRMGGDDAMTGLIQFGAGPALALPEQGLVVRGAAAQLDAAGWIAFAAKGEGASGLREVDVRVAALDLLGSNFPDTRVQLQREPTRTRVQLEGPAIAGRLDIASPLAQGVQGNFERLHWPAQAVPTPAQLADADAGIGRDPSGLPPMRFTVQDLRLGALALGRTELKASPVPLGLRVESFTTASPQLQIAASGSWLKREAQSSQSRFTVDYTATSLGELLTAFGLAGMVSEGPTQGVLDGYWPGSPGAFALARFNGRLKVEVGEGQLLEVEPGGGGRVLGLISLAEIPRRLSLDFSDFFQKGFGFNTMSGEFVFADGKASTDLLRIDGPSAEIRVSGATNLRTQEYDQRIEVLPKTGGVLPAIGAIAGGPVGAAVGAVAQAVLQQPLKQAGRTVYRVTGPWKTPKMEVVERGPPTPLPPASPAPVPSP
ncbi:MAG: TIGR02099 family protein [Arenimonas sp.]|nr:TIGR02099 family protein [Arenimonas sp.]